MTTANSFFILQQIQFSGFREDKIGHYSTVYLGQENIRCNSIHSWKILNLQLPSPKTKGKKKIAIFTFYRQVQSLKRPQT